MSIFNNPLHDNCLYQTLYGHKVIANPTLPESKPKIQLSERVQVSDEFRKKCNDYYADFFGEELVVYMVGESIVTHPNNIKIIGQAITGEIT